jgi:hypothetical protein
MASPITPEQFRISWEDALERSVDEVYADQFRKAVRYGIEAVLEIQKPTCDARIVPPPWGEALIAAVAEGVFSKHFIRSADLPSEVKP